VDVVFSNLLTGLSVSAVLLLIALGLTFTFGQMNIINFAHGELIMAGAYTAFVLQGLAGAEAEGRSFALALPAAFVVAGLLGLVMERTLLRRLYGRPLDTLLGAPNVQVVAPPWLSGTLRLGSASLPYSRLLIIGLTALAVAGIALFQRRLPAGRQMRAVMQHRQLAAVSGIPIDRVDGLTFLLGSGLAGVAGVALTLLGPIGPSLGTFYIVDAFLVVIVGGLGNLAGAMLAAVGIGVLNVFVEFSSQASIAKALVFAAVVVFLQYRPQGLFSLRTRQLT
jgi:urea transport system permease protein